MATTSADRSGATFEQQLQDARTAVDHGFITRWNEGSLTRDEVRVFAAQFHAHVDVWPRYVTTVHSITDDSVVRRSLIAALRHIEPAEGPTAGDLWLQTCAALGLFSDTVRSSTNAHATEACINDCLYLAARSTVSGTAVLWTLAVQMRELCRAKRDGLEHYGLASGPGNAFFDVIGYAADQQARMLRDVLEGLVGGDAELLAEVIDAVRAVDVAHAGLLAGSLSRG